MTEYVDITPSWSALVQLYMEALRNGTPRAQQVARSELARMAILADKYVEIVKAEQQQTTQSEG